MEHIEYRDSRLLVRNIKSKQLCLLLVRNHIAKNFISWIVLATKAKKRKVQCKNAKDAYNTRCSQAVSDPSTNRARRCLTWQIRRDAVFSTWYGRKRSRWSET